LIFSVLEAQNFFSIGEKVSWDLKDQGLVLVTGENHDSDAADSNGSGKSTLFEALIWCLWGKTVRGQTEDAVVNRKIGKDCVVQVCIEHEDEHYFITRHRKHHKHRNKVWVATKTADLTQGTPTLTQKKIDALLGIDYQTFIRGPMLPQGSFKRFSEMSDGEQKKILEQAVQIGVLKVAQDIVKGRIATTENNLTVASSALEKDATSLKIELANLNNFKEQQTNWDKTKRVELSQLQHKIIKFEEEEEKLLEKQPDPLVEEKLQRAKLLLEKISNESDSLENEGYELVKQAQTNLVDARFKYDLAVNGLREIKTGIDECGEITPDSKCPTCCQPITAEHIDRTLADLKKGAAAQIKVANQNKEAVDSWQKEVDNMQADLNSCVKECKERLQDVQAKHDELFEEKYRSDAWHSQISAVRSTKQTHQDLYHKAQNEASPYEELIKKCEANIEAWTAKIEEGNNKIKDLQSELDHLMFWREGFSNQGLKSLILDAVTPYINDRAAYYVQTLSAGELTIVFSTQTTIKSGETREKFSVSVTNKNGADTYAGNSGGEKGRADLAINFTLSDLVSSRARKAYPQRFFDEPFEGLDESGVEAVMDLLSNMAEDAGSIFVVSHQDSMKGQFNKTIRAVKQNGFTRLQ
jgi:DNA repair exonuclease SbcCD ATPase subunit